jgi:putative Mg2+ transporter-C (MgtC) family protein
VLNTPVEHSLILVGRLLLAFALTYALGFEREVRGSSAGDRTFAMIGVAGAMIGIFAGLNAPTALAGAVTGVGFIGAGLLFRQPLVPSGSTSAEQHGANRAAILHGVTTAAAIVAAAMIGAAAGEGLPQVAIAGTVLVLLSLELRYIPFLRVLDARRWYPYFRNDDDWHPNPTPPPGEPPRPAPSDTAA